MIAILPDGTQSAYGDVIKELATFTDISKWYFIYANPAAIESLFDSFKTTGSLDESLFSEKAFIIDMKLRLRGRKDDEDTPNGKLYGYNMRSVDVLKNKMKDDIDIIYYQLKKSAEKKERRQKKR